MLFPKDHAKHFSLLTKYKYCSSNAENLLPISTWMDGELDGWTDGQTDGRRDGGMEGLVDECMDGGMGVSMFMGWEVVSLCSWMVVCECERVCVGGGGGAGGVDGWKKLLTINKEI